MADSLRVPPATSLKFQEAATQVCNLAKLDFDQWPLQAHELVSHLEQRWVEGVESGLNTDAAEERALKLFGDLSRVAATLKKPWHRRVLSDYRYRADRYFIFFTASILSAWLLFLDVHFRPVYDSGTALTKADIEKFMLPFDWAFWVNGLGVFFVSLAGIASVACVRWSPNPRQPWLKALLEAVKKMKYRSARYR